MSFSFDVKDFGYYREIEIDYCKNEDALKIFKSIFGKKKFLVIHEGDDISGGDFIKEFKKLRIKSEIRGKGGFEVKERLRISFRNSVKGLYYIWENYGSMRGNVFAFMNTRKSMKELKKELKKFFSKFPSPKGIWLPKLMMHIPYDGEICFFSKNPAVIKNIKKKLIRLGGELSLEEKISK
ncbi:MAG: hypothetical protein ACE5J7_04530 [Candidatus Aenigmatarchaeota archaeon]